jgi:hypothetical protein
MSKPGTQSTGALRSGQCLGRRGSRLGDLCAIGERSDRINVFSHTDKSPKGQRREGGSSLSGDLPGVVQQGSR